MGLPFRIMVRVQLVGRSMDPLDPPPCLRQMAKSPLLRGHPHQIPGLDSEVDWHPWTCWLKSIYYVPTVQCIILVTQIPL